MNAEEKPRTNGGRSRGMRSNTPSSSAMYGAMPAAADRIVIGQQRGKGSLSQSVELSHTACDVQHP